MELAIEICIRNHLLATSGWSFFSRATPTALLQKARFFNTAVSL
uniref:Uncharacterized protein n=1 Tax=Arundo donax TaxID=35708 RepID=A0A0A9E8C4_ARUDO